MVHRSHLYLHMAPFTAVALYMVQHPLPWQQLPQYIVAFMDLLELEPLLLLLPCREGTLYSGCTNDG